VRWAARSPSTKGAAIADAVAPLRIAVVGAGALGSFVGARLAQAGQRVVLIGRAAHVEATRRDGLQVHGDGRVDRVRVEATTELAAVQDADGVLVCVKSADTAGLAQHLAPLLRTDAAVLSLQNGVDNAATLARGLGRSVGIAVAYIAAALPAPGVVQHSGGRSLVMGWVAAAAGLSPQPLPQPSLHGWAALFTHAGFEVRLTDQPLQALWDKLIVNCACNAVSGLAGAPYGAMAAQAGIRQLQAALVREAVAVAQAEGVPVQLAAALAAVERVALAMPLQHSSTAQDLARGRPTEIDQLNGHVAQRGAALGVPVPLNQALWALVKLAEGQRRPGPGKAG
jgi:2-dehydropantoate 2-reductase